MKYVWSKKLFIFKHNMTWKRSGILPNTILPGFASCLTFGKYLFVSCCDAVYHVTRVGKEAVYSILLQYLV